MDKRIGILGLLKQHSDDVTSKGIEIDRDSFETLKNENMYFNSLISKQKIYIDQMDASNAILLQEKAECIEILENNLK